MNFLRRVRSRWSFTLIELLVVIAIIAILAAILTPAVNLALFRGRLTRMISDGRGLYTLLFAQEMDNPLGLASKQRADWPKTSDGYADSTDYFATLVTNKNFNLSYAFFAGPGIEPAQSEAEFKDAKLRNAWCIALDVSDATPSDSPVLFTQNVKLPTKRLNDFQGLTANALPFGDRACVVITRGGPAYYLDQNTALATNFNRTGATNAVLYPKNGQY